MKSLITDAARAAVKQRFYDAGKSYADWADENKFDRDLVYAVISGRNQAIRGKGHEIAIALGLKEKPDPSSLFAGIKRAS